jgi:hypothetical protein
MTSRNAIALVVSAIVSVGQIAFCAAKDLSGEWTMTKSGKPDKVTFSLHRSSSQGSNFNTSSEWNLSEFRGLDMTTAGKHDVHFVVARDAGQIEGEGFLRDGEGAGLFRFIPDAKYADRMAALGFPGISDDNKQLAFALHNVSLQFARDVKQTGVQGLDTDKLLAFGIFGVSPTFINDVKSAGLALPDADHLIAFRIHGVTPELIRTMHQLGYSPDADKLVALRIHGASPEWINQLHQVGYDHVSLDNLIAFRIHGVSPEFINQLKKLGFDHPTPDQLVAMRIHGVTPE